MINEPCILCNEPAVTRMLDFEGNHTIPFCAPCSDICMNTFYNLYYTGGTD